MSPFVGTEGFREVPAGVARGSCNAAPGQPAAPPTLNVLADELFEITDSIDPSAGAFSGCEDTDEEDAYDDNAC